MKTTLNMDVRRMRKDVSLRAVARATGIPYPTVRSHHAGTRTPSIQLADLYAKFYGCTTTAILRSFTRRDS